MKLAQCLNFHPEASLLEAHTGPLDGQQCRNEFDPGVDHIAIKFSNVLLSQRLRHCVKNCLSLCLEFKLIIQGWLGFTSPLSHVTIIVIILLLLSWPIGLAYSGLAHLFCDFC